MFCFPLIFPPDVLTRFGHSLAGTIGLWGPYGICPHLRAAKQRALSCQAIDKLVNPSILVGALIRAALVEGFHFIFIFCFLLVVALEITSIQSSYKSFYS